MARADASPDWRADSVEALLELGRIDDALEVLDAWETDGATASPLAGSWPRRRAAAGSSRRLAGTSSAAASLPSEGGRRAHEESATRWGARGRCSPLGVVRGRAPHKRAGARRDRGRAGGLRGAAARSAGRRGRAASSGTIGGRTRAEGLVLTAVRRRVAALVAEGRTNREVAATLFLGERTVESHLTHVYAKLGVRSRVELARALAREA